MFKLYTKLSKINLNDSYSKALENEEYKVYQHSINYNDLDLVEDVNIKTFLFKHGDCFIIPLKNFSNETFGFVIRSVAEKAFLNVAINRKYPQMFGLHWFDDFAFNRPILITEGIKDVMALRQYYKYCLAYLTSMPGNNLYTYLTNITNRILIFPDNDRAGKTFLYDKVGEKYRNYRKWYTPFGKDLGEYFDGNEKTNEWVKAVLISENIFIQPKE